ncbi:uncharacterized protein BO80DRAFT_481876 [Aspergillus ibericus CBS 121593]|uniref:Alpha-galactosidase A n=1 Tax=Aspergillus ibericus CBS 121593 TaxID=1448316 RepID=A0A395GQE1_9EURO|nr:hypothetical protein BO80DRAFT_481876 [Aspergillus ibericus CBS 121593]RAK97562.1 hypothetical protein BO80DRAFT_481876 [Aspergillus ibericus CBS 121593]
MPSRKSPHHKDPIRVLTKHQDATTKEIIYRVQLHDQIKYISVAPTTYPPKTEINIPIPHLSAFGTHNAARAYRTKPDHHFKYTFEHWPGVKRSFLWHPTHIHCPNWEDPLTLSTAIRTALPPSIATSTCYTKFNLINITELETETMIYRLLKNNNILHLAPEFRGHLNENGRVMGFVLQKVGEGRPSGVDFEACRGVLQRYHELGLLHGNITKEHFLIQADGTARMVRSSRYQASGIASWQ